MDKTKKGISIIIGMLLICSIVVGALAIFLKVIVLNKNTYTNILDKNNTYKQINESIYTKIDSILSAKNINYDIKESIITEDDIRKEADTMISGLIDYLETGENNIKPLNTEVYKQRVDDILQSIFGNLKSNKNDLSFNNNLQIEDMAFIGHKVKSSNMVIVKDQSQIEQGSFNVEKLMSKEEAEARVREILKQKGLTEEQAIEKARKKGITEEQALNILAGYGITIDDDSKGNESTSEINDNSDNNSYEQNNYNAAKNSSEESSNEQTKNPVDQTENVKGQLNKITKKLQDEAESNIEKEVEKINLNKILESSKLRIISKVTSIVYRLFWVFITLPIILMVILIKINSKNFNLALKYISNAFLISGIVLLAGAFSIYASKVYEKFNISQAYLVDVISYTITYFSKMLIMYGTITVAVGLLMFIPRIVKKSNK